jgi:AraC-like DNA-binding protein
MSAVSAARLLYIVFCALGTLNGAVLAVHAWRLNRAERALNRLLAAFLALFCVRVSKTLLASLVPSLHGLLDTAWLASLALTPAVLFVYGHRFGASQGYEIRSRHAWAAAAVCGAVIVPLFTNYELTRQVVLGVLLCLGASLAWWCATAVRASWVEATRFQAPLTWSTGVAAIVGIVWLAYTATAWMHYSAYEVEALVFSVASYAVIFLELRSGYIAKAHTPRRRRIVGSDGRIDHLRLLMEQERVFLAPDLTLPALARQMKMSRDELSHLLNSGIGSSFSEFVNRYRVDECKRRLSEASAESRTVESIAYECGFNSLSSL